jgi:hypothetical protein
VTRTLLTLAVRGPIVNAATVSIVSKLQDEAFEGEIRVGDLLKAAIVVGPLAAAYFISRYEAFADLGLIAISLLIAAFKLRLPPKVITLHLLAILVGLVALFLAEPIKPLFVLLAASAAFFPALCHATGRIYERSAAGRSFRRSTLLASCMKTHRRMRASGKWALSSRSRR